MTLSATSVSLNSGGTGTITVTVARSGGFGGAVTIAGEGLPEGVTADAPTIAPGSTSGTLEFTAAAGYTGNATLTMRGTGPGVAARTATIDLTVNDPAAPEFSLAVGSAAATLAAGESTDVQITLTRTGGFTGSVALAASGLPAGVTASFNPATIAAGATTSTMTLTAGVGAAASTGTVTVQGTGTGVGQRTATFSLQVTASTGGGDISYTFCGLTGISIWMAVQNDNGPWTSVSGTNGTFEFGLAANRGGVAWVIEPSAGRYGLNVLYTSKEQIASYGQDLCEGAEGTGKTVNATVTGVAATDIALVTLGGVMPAVPPGPLTGDVTFPGVADGPVDLIAGLTEITSFAPFTMTPKKFIIRRGLTPAPGSALAPIDFGGPEAFEPAASPLTVIGVGGGETLLTMTGFNTANGFSGAASQATGTSNWYGIPADRLAAGDLHVIIATAASATPLAPTRAAIRMVAESKAVTLDLGPGLTVPTVEALPGAGHARARARYTIQQEYDRTWIANFSQGDGNRGATVQMTETYRGGATGTVDLEIPEFDGVAGWTPAWGLQSGQQTTWNLPAVGWNTPGGVLQAPYADGAEYRTASRLGQFTP